MNFVRAARLAAVIAVALVSAARAENPIIQTRFTADPAPLVHDGVVYLYTGHDEDDATGFKMLDWRLYSSTRHGQLDRPRRGGLAQDLPVGEPRQ